MASLTRDDAVSRDFTSFEMVINLSSVLSILGICAEFFFNSGSNNSKILSIELKK